MRISDWSSDVCSSDLDRIAADPAVGHPELQLHVVGQAVAGAQGAGDACGLDLAHVDQADQDRRDDGVADQRDAVAGRVAQLQRRFQDRSEEHTSELQSLMRISYAVFCLNKITSYIS